MLKLIDFFEYAEEVRRSRFIARASPVPSPEVALAFLESVRETEAAHNCWAFRIGGVYRFSDDGEPGGTAGRPILNSIEHQNVDRVMVVVTRYFGGIKLGAGGLIRAYGGVAAKCLQRAPKREIRSYAGVRLVVGFEHIGAVHTVLNHLRCRPMKEEFSTHGVSIDLTVEQALLADLKTALNDATRGAVSIVVTGTEAV